MMPTTSLSLSLSLCVCDPFFLPVFSNLLCVWCGERNCVDGSIRRMSTFLKNESIRLSLCYLINIYVPYVCMYDDGWMFVPVCV
jgi:hypothetical protein